MFRLLLAFAAFALLTPQLLSQSPAPTSQKSLLIVPFENLSKAPGIEWIGESFPEVIGQRLAGAGPAGGFQLVPRSTRLRAFDRAGLPLGVHPSRATLFRVAVQLNLDYVVMGTYTFDGQSFTASCQRLDVKHPHLSKPIAESGPLVKLIDIQTALTWDLERLDDPALTSSRDAFVAAAPPIRLDSLENYTRGIIANSSADKIKYFREALRINPANTEAEMALGEWYFDSKQYDPAAAALAKIPSSHPAADRAQFMLGLCSLYLGQPDKAETSFADLAARLPLPEVYNNLGVARARMGKPSALESLQKASDANPDDAEYHFNLAVALFRKGDLSASTRELRIFLAANSNDPEAKALLETLVAASDPKYPATAPPPKLPMERPKRAYSQDAFPETTAQPPSTPVPPARTLESPPRRRR